MKITSHQAKELIEAGPRSWMRDAWSRAWPEIQVVLAGGATFGELYSEVKEYGRQVRAQPNQYVWKPKQFFKAGMWREITRAKAEMANFDTSLLNDYQIKEIARLPRWQRLQEIEHERFLSTFV